MSNEAPESSGQKPLPKADNHGIGLVGTSIIVFIIGVVVGVPIANFGADVLVEYAGQVFGILFAIFLVIILVAGLIALFRRQIWGAIFKRAEIEMDRFARPMADVARFAAEQRVSDATSAARDLAELVLARYAWVSTRRWLIATITALIAAIAALAGSALLFQQNNLLRSQMDLMAQQNDRVGEQNRLLETQIELGEAQRSAGIVTEILAIGSKVAEESQALGAESRDTISTVELSAPLRQRIVSVSTIAHPYRFLNGGLMNLSGEQQYLIAMNRRADLLPQGSRMFADLPDPSRSELTDRSVSPERGQLLALLDSSHFTDSEILTAAGLDLSFAYFRKGQLKDMSLNHGQLRFADFSGQRIVSVTFRGAYLENSRFIGATMMAADFTPISSVDANPPYRFEADPVTYLTYAAGADFSRGFLSEVKFGGAQLLAANFDRTTLGQVSFSSASLRLATFRGALLDRPDFTGADLSLVDFDGAITDNADFIAATASVAAAGTFAPGIHEIEPITRQSLRDVTGVEDLSYTQWTGDTQLYRIKRIRNFE